MATKTKSSSKSKSSNVDQLVKSTSLNIKGPKVSTQQAQNPSIENLINKLASQYINKSASTKLATESYVFSDLLLKI